MTKNIEEKESLKRSELTKQNLVGKWIGIYEYDSTYMNETTHIADSSFIEFDTNSITLYDFRKVENIRLKWSSIMNSGVIFTME